VALSKRLWRSNQNRRPPFISGRDTMTALLLLRHAESVWNEDGRLQGWADSPLSSSGSREARSWSRQNTMSFEAVVSSDLTRSRSTAQLIAQGAGARHLDLRPGLREQDQGEWTGLTKAEVKRIWPQLARERPRQPYGGETSAQLAQRVTLELEELASTYRGRRVLVVTHAGVIKAVERALGCEDIPVPHLQGRWILHSNPPPKRLPSGSAVESLKERWHAGATVPKTRTAQSGLITQFLDTGFLERRRETDVTLGQRWP
jgi:probable phosphoglycerate mutase